MSHSAVQRAGLRGYVTNRRFKQFLIPVPLQSLALRDYCARKGKIYVLPVNENSFPHSYMVLEGIVEDLESFEGIIMYSMHMLPERTERRKAIYQRVLDQGCCLHFVLEDAVIAAPGDIASLEDLLVFSQIASAAPKLDQS
jgi:sporadic carbohydrate cluster protein (TIGR04323 family)